jgi:hypothetical protein
MIERELSALADRLAPDPAPDLTQRVLARLDDRPRRGRRRAAIAAAAGALAAGSLLSPQVRAVAEDLLGVAGIEFSSETPDAPLVPREPLPDRQPATVSEARAAVDFPLGVPGVLGTPEEVIVSDDARVVTMSWQGGRLVLDQFAARLGPVFEKHVGGVEYEPVVVAGAGGWWLPEPHDLTYIDRDGHEVTATARLAGPSLIWEAAGGVTLRLEGERLDLDRALRIARSVG